MRSNRQSLSTDGFLLNLGYVLFSLLQDMEPFNGISSKSIEELIDLDFCILPSRFEVDDDTKVLVFLLSNFNYRFVQALRKSQIMCKPSVALVLLICRHLSNLIHLKSLTLLRFKLDLLPHYQQEQFLIL